MSEVNFFWNGWEPIGRIIVVGTLAYISMIFILRATGKRTLVSMNAFDFIITVAIGAAFGRILTARQVTIAEAFTAFLLLAMLQYIVSWIEVRWPAFANLITAQPTLLFYESRFLEKVMRKQRIRQEDILAAVRKERISSLSQVKAVILESDGTLAVVKKSESTDDSALKKLKEQI